MAELALPQYPDSLIKQILRSVKTIAMVGASGNDIRPSYFAMMYLLNKGYKVVPVNPGMVGKESLGQKVYGALKDVPAPVDMVDIFREAKYAPDIARETVAEKDRLGVKVLWMQLSVISPEAEKIAQAPSAESSKSLERRPSKRRSLSVVPRIEDGFVSSDPKTSSIEVASSAEIERPMLSPPESSTWIRLPVRRA